MCETNLNVVLKSKHRLTCKGHWSDPDKTVPYKPKGRREGIDSFICRPFIYEFWFGKAGDGWGRIY